MSQSDPRAVPSEVSHFLKAWLWRRRLSIALHNTMGIVGLAASLGASSGLLSGSPQVWAFISALSIAVLAFVNPRREYTKFAKAVRVLDVAILRYRHGIYGIEELVDAVERGEAIIGEVEDREEVGSAEQVKKSLKSV